MSKKRAHIIGVTVSETSPDTTSAAPTVIANSLNSRPMTPLMSKTGMKTAISEVVIDTTVKPTSRAPLRAASNGAAPPSTWRAMFSITTIASSTTNPTAMVSP